MYTNTNFRPDHPATGIRGALSCASLAGGETGSVQDKVYASVAQIARKTRRASGKIAGYGRTSEEIRVGTVNVGTMNQSEWGSCGNGEGAAFRLLLSAGDTVEGR